jgi:hypothetical protein
MVGIIALNRDLEPPQGLSIRALYLMPQIVKVKAVTIESFGRA